MTADRDEVIARRTEIVGDYVARGWIPFAYASDTTPPYQWQDSRIDETTVQAISAVKTPVGIVLGQESGIVVVDIDVQSGGSLNRVVDRYGEEESRTRIVETPSGGYHLYYEYPKGVQYLPKRINSGRWIDGMTGVDLLADGHHVQAPPTDRVGVAHKPDGSYKLIGDFPVAPLPARLLADWLGSLTVESDRDGEVVDLIPEADRSWALELHRAKVAEAAAAEPGVRDETVYRCMCVSVRVATYLPDDLLTVAEVESDYVSAYEAAQGEEIIDVAGKIRRATDLALDNPWRVETTAPAPLPEGVPEDQRTEYEKKVQQYVTNALAKDEAHRLLADAAASELELPPIVSGTELARQAKESTSWAIDGLLAPEQSVLLTAQKKSGKTTLVLNLIHSLTTGEPFLGKYQPARPMRVAYVDLELGSVMASSYLDQIGVPRDQVFYVNLRGLGKTFDTRSEVVRNKWARKLRELEIDAIVIDPVSPILSAANLDENATTGVRQLLDSFDALARSAGCTLGPIVVHHAGWSENNRARGSSAFGDWPGAEWNLRRPDSDDPHAGRTFAVQSNRATGGIVHVPQPLGYDHSTRRTWYAAEPVGPADPKRVAYDEFVGASSGPITAAEVQFACGLGSLHTARDWLDGDPRLVVVYEGGRGKGAREWARVE